MANLWRQTCFQHITAGQVGFTENEVSGLCDRYGIDPDEVKNWYDGYSLGDDLSVYSPRSVVNCMQFGKVANYWNQTESFEALKLYIDMIFDGLRDDVLSMIAGEAVPVNTGSFTNDMTTFRTEDDVLTRLIHLGYLAYDEKNRAAFIPNNEIRSEYVNAVSASDWGSVSKALKDSADMVYIPRKKYPEKPAIVVELKWNQDTETAISQIREKEYCKSLEDYRGKILLVGINYDRKTRKHQCRIEEENKE